MVTEQKREFKNSTTDTVHKKDNVIGFFYYSYCVLSCIYFKRQSDTVQGSGMQKRYVKSSSGKLFKNLKVQMREFIGKKFLKL